MAKNVRPGTYWTPCAYTLALNILTCVALHSDVSGQERPRICDQMEHDQHAQRTYAAEPEAQATKQKENGLNGHS